MEEHKITQAVIRYLVENADNLEGTMTNFLIPITKIYLVRSPTIDEYGTREKTEFYRGNIAEIIAEKIEQNDFFGWYVNNSNINDNSNSKIELLKGEQEVFGKFKIRTDGDEIIIDCKSVNPKKYLNSIMDPEGFKQSANLLGIDKNLDLIVEKLYK